PSWNGSPGSPRNSPGERSAPRADHGCYGHLTITRPITRYRESESPQGSWSGVSRGRLKPSHSTLRIDERPLLGRGPSQRDRCTPSPGYGIRLGSRSARSTDTVAREPD